MVCPLEAGATDVDGVALFRRWCQLAGLYALLKKLPRSNAELFDVFRAATMPEAIDRLVLATGWERGTVEAFIGPDGLAIDSVAGLRPPVEPGDEPTILRLARAVDAASRRRGAGDAAAGRTIPDADGATTIVRRSRRATTRPGGWRSRGRSTSRCEPNAATRWSRTAAAPARPRRAQCNQLFRSS
jgi:hypothetical protein